MQDFNTLFLAGGYGSRLARDLTAASLTHLLNLPKGLLPLAGKPLLSHWLDRFSFSRCYLISNHLYLDQFLAWSQTVSPSPVVIDNGTLSNETRLGSIGDLEFILSRLPRLSQDPLLIIASDTLFLKDFSLSDFVNAYARESALAPARPSLWVTCYTLPPDQSTAKSGILELDSNNNVVQFLEKPAPSETRSRLACPCFYLIPPQALPLVSEFLKEKSACPLEDKDATGKWIAWMVNKYPIKAMHISGRLDIGGLASYNEAQKYMAEE